MPDDTRNFSIFRYTIYTISILGYALYLAYLAHQLATDEPFLIVKYHFVDTIDVPIMNICGHGYFDILGCDHKYNDGTQIQGECMKYVSDITYDSDNQRYCRTFKAETIKYVHEKPDGLNKLKFFYNINVTEAEAKDLGVALLTVDFLSPGCESFYILPSNFPTLSKIDFKPLLKMDKAIQERFKLQGNFIPAVVDSVALMKFRTKIYRSILPWDFRAIIGFTPAYHSTSSIECQVNNFPINKNPYDMQPGTNGYFSVNAGDFILEETTEKRTVTVLNTFASAGGAFGIVGTTLIFLFGSSLWVFKKDCCKYEFCTNPAKFMATKKNH